jgi:hypothetical protein
MNQEDILNHLKTRRTNFVLFRWLLFIWLGALEAYKAGHGIPLDMKSEMLMGVILLSQIVLAKLPLKYFEGLKVFYAIFLLDLNFILLGFWFTGQMQTDLVMALFLGMFVSALAKELKYSILAALVVAVFYMTLKSRTPEGFDFSQPEQLLRLPFLFIASIHSGLVAQEATAEATVMRLLHSERQNLAGQLKSTFVEVAKFSHDVGALLDSLPFGMIMLDPQGKLTVFNDMAEFTFGLLRANVVGSTLKRHAALAALEPKIVKSMSNPEDDCQIIDIPFSEGQPWQMNMSTYPILDEAEASLGTLIVLTPLSYHESMSEQLERVKSQAKAETLPEAAKPALPVAAAVAPVRHEPVFSLPPLPHFEPQGLAA